MNLGNLADLFAPYDAASQVEDHELARRYAPIIQFDAAIFTIGGRLYHFQAGWCVTFFPVPN